MLTRGRFSHAGICIREADQIAAEAHPSDEESAISIIEIVAFFDRALSATGRGLFRFTGTLEEAAFAAGWADRRCGWPCRFNLWDPILGDMGQPEFDDQLYCSEFVWWSYLKGADVELVDKDHFLNLLSDPHRENTLRVLVDMVKSRRMARRFGSDEEILEFVLDRFVGNHDGHFVTPDQLAKSPLTAEVELPLDE